MQSRDFCYWLTLVVVTLVVSVATSLCTRWMAGPVALATPAVPPPPPPPKPPTEVATWLGCNDTDCVPVQIITMGSGHAWFVVGTDTVSWTPLVWLFDPATGQWSKQHGGDLPTEVR